MFSSGCFKTSCLPFVEILNVDIGRRMRVSSICLKIFSLAVDKRTKNNSLSFYHLLFYRNLLFDRTDLWFRSNELSIETTFDRNLRRERGRHIQIRKMYRRTVNKTTWSNPRYNTKLFYFSVWGFETLNERVSIYHERACERQYFPEYLQRATRTGIGFNKIMRTSNGFNTVIMYILPSKQEREILFEAN